MTPIYLDNNSTTPLLPAVWDAMRLFAVDQFGNPASSHAVGRAARRALEDAREKVARLLGATAAEVTFTSGATEANNLAVFGLAGSSPCHVAASSIEHPSVVEPLRRLAERGWTVDWLPVDSVGVMSEVPNAEARLACVMLANHETGAVQPVQRIARQLPVHCDAVQAVGKIPVHFHDLGTATLSLSAHKFHGPKGVGALLVRQDVKVPAQLLGGHQQRGRRPGTEPVHLAVGLATALEFACREMADRTAHVRRLREAFLTLLRREAAPVVLNGPEAGGVPHTINVAFPGCRADVLLMNLDLAGVACSTGSACSSGSLLPSPVLTAMRVPQEVLASSMRFSLSPLLTVAEVEEAARRIVIVVRRLQDVTDESMQRTSVTDSR